MNKPCEGSLLVGYSFSTKDSGTLLVGTQVKGHTTILNAFSGAEAEAIFQILTGEKR